MKISAAEFIEGVTYDINAQVAEEINARCETFVNSDGARYMAMTAFDNLSEHNSEEQSEADFLRNSMHSCLDSLVDSFGFQLK